MLFLLRHPEIGKEPHAIKSKARHDIMTCLHEQLPGARVEVETGRLFVTVEGDEQGRAREVLAGLHGVTSLSPCERCTLDRLDERFDAMARAALAPGVTFAVRVRSAGPHHEPSPALARRLGTRALAAVPGARVDLGAPDVELGVEVRGPTAYLYHEVIPGLDERAAPTRHLTDERRFVVDHMLGTLATRLRLLGFDTLYCRDTADSLLLRKADEEGRTLLTQDHNLARLGAGAAHRVEARDLDAQVAEVLARFHLEVDPDAVLSRCSLCNTPLEPVDKALVADRLPERVALTCDVFFRCPVCDKVYWKGRHHEQMRLL